MHDENWLEVVRCLTHGRRYANCRRLFSFGVGNPLNFKIANVWRPNAIAKIMDTLSSRKHGDPEQQSHTVLDGQCEQAGTGDRWTVLF